uniref:Uncharacterized protein n=1 Tax=Candidatus Kentrum sp. TC TaxID=2126339 RepID=A0A450Z097_9GAMM|nr:MAG: hypothetical protein BECKTC1821D_GA0114238_104214 [Candidatus Kentron sp. TC]
MAGMSAFTGKHFSDIAHLRQSITDILTTPIGSRVMRREYGLVNNSGFHTFTGIFPIRFCHSAGPVLCTDSPLQSTATVTGISRISNS